MNLNQHRGALRAHPLDANAAVLAEVLRVAANPHESVRQEIPADARLPAFWKLFGATLLSIAALIVITLCQQFSSGLGDVRKDVLHLSQTQGALIRGDDLNGRLRTLWERIRDLEADRAVLVTLKEKSATLAERLGAAEQECRALARSVQEGRTAEVAVGEAQKLVRELKRLREDLATPEDRKAAFLPTAHRHLNR